MHVNKNLCCLLVLQSREIQVPWCVYTCKLNMPFHMCRQTSSVLLCVCGGGHFQSRKRHHEGKMRSEMKREGDLCHYASNLIIERVCALHLIGALIAFWSPPFPPATHTPTYCIGYNNARLILSSMIITHSFSMEIRIKERKKDREDKKRSNKSHVLGISSICLEIKILHMFIHVIP